MSNDQSPLGGPPDFDLCIKTQSGRTNIVAGVWKRSDGSLRLKLSPGVVLDWKAMEDCYLTAFPREKRKPEAG